MNSYIPEIEFKFFPESIETVLRNLAEKAHKTKERTLLKAIGCRREDNPQFHNMDVLRLRNEGKTTKLTMKQRYQNSIELDHALEKEFSVHDFDTYAELFEHLGIFFSVQSEKYRTTWGYNGCEIVLDENPWLEPYFEIEGPDEATIQSVSEDLVCNWESRRNISSRQLYIEKYGEHARNVRVITFAENPFLI